MVLCHFICCFVLFLSVQCSGEHIRYPFLLQDQITSVHSTRSVFLDDTCNNAPLRRNISSFTQRFLRILPKLQSKRCIATYEKLWRNFQRYSDTLTLNCSNVSVELFLKKQIALELFTAQLLGSSDQYRTIEHAAWIHRSHRCQRLTMLSWHRFHTFFMQNTLVRMGVNGTDKERLHFGYCIPNACFYDDLELIERYLVQLIDERLTPQRRSHAQRRANREWSAHQVLLFGQTRNIICGVILVVTLSLPFLHSLHKRLFGGPKDDRASWTQAFDSRRNIRTLLQRPKNELKLISVLRTVSLLWIILGHLYMVLPTFVQRPRQFARLLNTSVASMFAVNFHLAVDTFLVIGGAVNAYGHFSAGGGRLTIRRAIRRSLRRAGRLWPPYAALMLLSSTVFLWGYYYPIWTWVNPNHQCQSGTFCWNVLFLNNLFAPLCLPWTWSVAMDMQFYSLSPIVLNLLADRGRAAMMFVIGVVLLSGGLRMAIAAVNNLGPTALFFALYPNTYSNEIIDQYLTLYINPFTRVGPYLIGIMLGYRLADTTTIDLLASSRKWFSLGCMLLLQGVIIIWPYVALNADPYWHVDLVYAGFAKTAWSLTIAYCVVLANRTDFARLMTSVEGCIFTVIANLSYCAYLFHGLVVLGVLLFIPMHKSPLLLDGHADILVYYYLPVVAISLLAALFFNLAVELPASNILKSVSCSQKLK